MRLKKILPSLGIILCAFLVFVIYARQVNDSVARDNFTFISEMLNQSRIGAQRAISDMLKSEERISLILADFYGENLGDDRTMDFLRVMTTESDFIRMGLLFPDGRAITTDNKHFSLLDRDYAQKAFKGITNLSPLLHERAEQSHGAHFNVYATPVRLHGKVAAVLFAATDTAFLGQMLSTTVFDGKSLSYLIHKNGSLVAAQRMDAFIRFEPLYESFLKQSAVLQEENGVSDELDMKDMIRFTDNGQYFWGTVIPVGVDDVYMFTAVPCSIIAEQASHRVHMTAWLLVALAILGLLLLSQVWNWIHEAELQSALARDEAARNAAKSAFLSMMSHEMRTPLNAIVGFLHLLGRTTLDDYQRNAVRKASLGASSLTRIICDVLDFSKIESGQITLESTQFSVSMLVDVLSSILAESAREKELTLRMFVAPDVPANLSGDGARLTQVLLNLLSNAIKFTEKGEVSLHVGLQALKNNQATLQFSVRDTGIGIEQERMSTIFGHFEIGDCSSTRVMGGTGLGLTICVRLVELMGGKLGVDSVVGQGSDFHFTITLPVSETVPKVVRSETNSTETQSWSGRRVLVAEDNSINQEILREFLESYGLTADMVENGEQAIELAKSSDYPLIFMDIQMPKMDGIEATKRIRALGQAPESPAPWLARTPIVALTANAMVEDRDRCLGAGMNDFMTKPINTDVMTRCLHKWLDSASLK